MKKAIKIIAIIILIIIVLLILAFAYLALFVNPNDFKPTIEKKVKQYTGRTIKIPGKLSWSFFPTISLSTGKVILDNPAGFGKKPFAKIGQANINISLFALLGGNLNIKNVTLKGLHLNLMENKQGQNNWTFGKPSTHSETTNTNKITAPSSQPSTLPNFQIPSLEISNANISYTNAMTGQHVAISKFMATTQDVSTSSAFPFKASFNVYNAKPKTLGHIKFMAQVRMTENGVQLNKLDFAANITSEQFNNKPIALHLKGNVTVKNHGMSIKGMTLTLNHNTMTGNVNVKNLATYDATFNLKSNQIDAARILPASRQSSNHLSGPSSQAPNSSNQPIVLPPILKKLNVDGTLKIKTLNYNKLTIQNVDLKVNAHNGLIQAPLTADIYKGKLNSSTIINDQTVTPAFKSNIHLNNVDMQPLFYALTNKNNVSGTASFNSNLSTSGNTQLALRKGLNGKAQFHIKNGVIKGIDIAYYFQVARSLSKHEGTPSQKGANETTFGDFSGTFNIHHGIASNNDLSLTNPAFNLNGHGKINFVTERYEDYHLNVVAKNGNVIPLLVKGHIQKPQIQVDVGELLKNTVKQKLGNELKKVFDGGHIRF